MKRYWLYGRDGDRACSIQFFDSDITATHSWMPQTAMQGHPHIRTAQIDAFLKATGIIRRAWNDEPSSEGGSKGIDARQEAATVLEAAGWKTELGEADDNIVTNDVRANVRMPTDLWAWARQQPEGASDLVRRLLEQERARQDSQPR